VPIYEYVCKSCQHQLEALQKLSDAPLVECPQCHQPTLQKKISAAGFRLSGSGWYETDFKSGGKKNLAGENKGESTGQKSGEAGSGDSKPAASTSSKSEPAAKSSSTSAAKDAS